MPKYSTVIPDSVINAWADRIMRILHAAYPKMDRIFESSTPADPNAKASLQDYLELIHTPLETEEEELLTAVKNNPINQMLLHGLMHPVEEWSPLYCSHIISLTKWLSDSAHPETPGLMEFKQSYQPLLLMNLSFMALVQTSGLSDDLKVLCLELNTESDGVVSQPLFFKALVNPTLNSEQRMQILTMVQDNMGTILQSGYMLAALLIISPKLLNDQHLEKIWSHTPLQMVITDVLQLLALFKLPQNILSHSQRTRILTELSLDKLVQNEEQLNTVISLFPIQLNGEHLEQLRTSLKKEAWFTQTFFGAPWDGKPLQRSRPQSFFIEGEKFGSISSQHCITP